MAWAELEDAGVPREAVAALAAWSRSGGAAAAAAAAAAGRTPVAA